MRIHPSVVNITGVSVEKKNRCKVELSYFE